jgi:uncharacterized SAM-binding protein YcdF (DUF218 family)
MSKFISTIIILLAIYGIGKLGIFFDISQREKPVDIIVSLGGDNGKRIKKVLSLYKNKISKSGKIIITGVDGFDKDMKPFELDWRADYLEKKGVKKEDIVLNTRAKNTLEEVFFIKDYMISNNLHSVVFVTDAPHSRRIHYFIKNIANYKDNNLNHVIVSTDNEWWDRDRFYTDPEAVIFVVNESIKLIYYYIQNLLGNLNID